MANDPENVNLTPQIEEEPTPQISGEPAGQTLDPASDSAITLQDVLASPELQDYIKKEVQSKTDSRLGTYGTRLDSVEGAIARYDALVDGGMSKPEALAKMQGDQRLHDLESEVASLRGGNVVVPSSGDGEKPWGERQQAILKDAGVQPDDVRLTEFLKTNTFKTHDEYIDALNAKAFEWKQSDAKKPKPSATTVASTVPAVPAGEGDYTTDKYVEDILAARGNKGKLNAIRAKARADGLDIDRISINV
jgi:hypothetical protein